MRGAKRETRFAAVGDLPGFFRKPFGPGWALVGDAGYHKDPITAFGITDAFRDAEAVARRARRRVRRTPRLRRGDGGVPAGPRRGVAAGVRVHLRLREDRAAAAGDAAAARARSQGNQEAMDDFVSVMAGTLPAPEFFAPDNVGRIMGEAHTAAPPDPRPPGGRYWARRRSSPR